MPGLQQNTQKMRFILQENESVYLDEHRMEEEEPEVEENKDGRCDGFPL